jgi:hypothetical protein
MEQKTAEKILLDTQTKHGVTLVGTPEVWDLIRCARTVGQVEGYDEAIGSNGPLATAVWNANWDHESEEAVIMDMLRRVLCFGEELSPKLRYYLEVLLTIEPSCDGCNSEYAPSDHEYPYMVIHENDCPRVT